MNRNHLDFQIWEKKSLKNPRIRAEYDKLQPEFTVIQAMIDARRREGLTQKVLAERVGTKQSVISRLESGRANPTVGFLKKLAQALDARLEIRFASPG